jgi:hypothetical protein
MGMKHTADYQYWTSMPRTAVNLEIHGGVMMSGITRMIGVPQLLRRNKWHVHLMQDDAWYEMALPAIHARPWYASDSTKAILCSGITNVGTGI